MRRDAHPANARSNFLIAPRTAAALALLALALTLATGALRSPFLLLLPLPVLVLLLALERRDARWALGSGTLLLLIGQYASAGLGVSTASAAMLGTAALLLLSERLRRRVLPAAAAPLEALPAGPSRAPLTQLDELHALLERTRLWTGAVAVTAWQCDGGVARPVAAAGRTLPLARPLEGDPLGWVAREGTPIWFAPTPEWSDPGASVAAGRLRGEVGAEWLITTEYTPEQGRPAHEDLDAAHAALRLFIEVRAAQQRTAAHQERLEKLIALLRRIPIEFEAKAFGRELLDATMLLTGATGGTLAAWRDDSGEVLVTVGDDGGPRPGTRFAPPAAELALAVRAGAALERTGGSWRPGSTHVASETDPWHLRPRTLLSVPLSTPAGVVGVLGLWSSRAPRLDPAAIDLLQTVLPYAALHLEHSRELGRMRDRADTDPLTGLLNRRGFESAFLAERQRLERYGHPLSLCLLDIDHFKTINDTHGHDAGDEVLRTVAALLRHAIRDVDVAARHGGEEFVVLLPETPITAAREVAERIRAAVAQAPITSAGTRVPVRVSIGVTACPELVAAPADLVASADAALYEAKRAGRDRVVVAAAGPPQRAPTPSSRPSPAP